MSRLTLSQGTRERIKMIHCQGQGCPRTPGTTAGATPRRREQGPAHKAELAGLFSTAEQNGAEKEESCRSRCWCLPMRAEPSPLRSRSSSEHSSDCTQGPVLPPGDSGSRPNWCLPALTAPHSSPREETQIPPMGFRGQSAWRRGQE